MDELGQILANLINIVPDGMVVFFPSYNFLNALRVRWGGNGILERFKQKKKVRVLPSYNAAHYGTALLRTTRKWKCG